MDDKLRKILDDILTEIESGKLPEMPQLRSRLDIISTIFEMKLSQVGIEPSLTVSDIPSPSQTPLAKYLRRLNVHDDIIDAILSAVSEEGDEEAIHEIIEAVADTPEIYMHGDELEHLHRMTDHSKWALFWEKEFGLLSSRLRRIRRAGYPAKYWKYDMISHFFRVLAQFLISCGLTTKETNAIIMGLAYRDSTAQYELKRIANMNLIGFPLISRMLFLLGLIDDDQDVMWC